MSDPVQVALSGPKATAKALVMLIDEADRYLVEPYRWNVAVSRGGLYARRHCGGGRVLYLHRLLAGACKGEVVDHINGNTLDNRRENLRLCTHQENRRNTKSRASTSVFKGVSRRNRPGRKTTYKASVVHRGKKVMAREFSSELEAALAYDEAARPLHGAFGRYNFPRPGELSARKENGSSEEAPPTSQRPQPRTVNEEKTA